MQRIRVSALLTVLVSLLCVVLLLGASCSKRTEAREPQLDELTVGASMGQDADELMAELEE